MVVTTQTDPSAVAVRSSIEILLPSSTKIEFPLQRSETNHVKQGTAKSRHVSHDVVSDAARLATLGFPCPRPLSGPAVRVVPSDEAEQSIVRLTF